MTSLTNKNAETIKRAFDRLRSVEYRVVHEGMIRVARAGLDYLVESHVFSGDFTHHVEETNTLAWAVAYKGSVVSSGSHSGGDNDIPGRAKEIAEAIAKEHPTGWIAIVLSEMEGYYNVQQEVDFLNDTILFTKDNFFEHFRPYNA